MVKMYPNSNQRKEQVITHIENFYCDRLTELVDQKKINEAHAVFEEFVVDTEEPCEWFFIKQVEV
tara:strand:- start:135 stop:329 length:195 start_codon:yes stop_codon:yes gene_type:complete